MTQAFNFRATSGYVTDAGGETPVLGVTTTGIVISGGAMGARDRSTSIDYRLAGLCYAGNGSGTVSTVTVTLPATGSYDIVAAFGDHDNAQEQYVTFKDGGTIFASLTGVATAANSYADATGTVLTAANWPTAQTPLTHTFTSTTFTVDLGPEDGSTHGNLTTICHLKITPSASGSTPIAFAGTIPTLIYDEGDTVDEDLSSYFSGTETPFTYADIGADFSATGLSLNTSTGHLTGTATTASVSGCQIEGTDATPDTADSNTFTITVNAVDTTNPSATGTPTFSAVTKNSATVSFTAATDDTAVDGYEYRLDGGSAVDIGDVLTFDLSAQTPGATVTVEARAYDPAGNRGAWTGADVTFLIWGFDFDDEDLDLNLGNFSGTQVGLGLALSTNITLSVQAPDTRAVVVEDVQTTDGTTGRLPRYEDGSLDSGTYLVVGQTTETDPADRMCFAILMDTTS